MNFKEIFTFNSESSELVLTKDDELFLEKIAKKIHQHGMVTPAVFFLEMTKPLSLLGSHFLVFFGRGYMFMCGLISFLDDDDDDARIVWGGFSRRGIQVIL